MCKCRRALSTWHAGGLQRAMVLRGREGGVGSLLRGGATGAVRRARGGEREQCAREARSEAAHLVSARSEGGRRR